MRWPLGMVLMFAACESEALEPAVFGEVCGVNGPFHLIPLAEERTLWSLEQLEKRYIYVTRRSGDGFPQDFELWSTGLCGESPRRIAEDVSATFQLEQWPGVLFGCRDEANDIVSLDLAGAVPPHVVFADTGCQNGTPYGFVSFGDASEPGPLLLHPFPSDPRSETSEPVVLLPSTPIPDPTIKSLSNVVVLPEMIFLRDHSSALLRIDLPGGIQTVEQADVREFEVSRDGRYLLWQDLQLTGADPDRPEGTVLLRDRVTGEGVSLTQTGLRYTSQPLLHIDAGYVQLVLGNGLTRIYSVPSFGFIDLPQGLLLDDRIPDGRWLLHSRWDGKVYLSDLRNPESLTLLGSGQIVNVGSNGVMVQDLPACCVTKDYQFDEAPLWLLPFDGTQPLRLTEAVSRGAKVMEDEWIIATLNVDENLLADLVLVDLSSDTLRILDRKVVFSPFGATVSMGNNVFRYLVSDGERSGVWLAQTPLITERHGP